MSSIDLRYYSKLKKEFMNEKGPEVEAVGYHMACGLSFVEKKDSPNVSCHQEGLERKVCFGVRLSPLPGSPDPIEDNLLAKIKNEILTDNYKEVPLDIKYVGIIRPRKE